MENAEVGAQGDEGGKRMGKPSVLLEIMVTLLAMVGAVAVLGWGALESNISPFIYGAVTFGVLGLGVWILVRARKRRGCRQVIPIASLCVTAAFAAVLVPVLLLVLWCYGMDHAISAKSHQLFYKTDQAQLLAACREVMAHPELYGTSDVSSESKPHKEEVPKIITDLNPAYWMADEKCMYIALSCGFHHSGPLALADGVKVSENSFPGFTPRFELVPGLWFAEDEGKIRSTRYPPEKGYRKAAEDE